MDEIVTRRHYYLSQSDSPKHRSRVGVYLVETLTGSNVVARITPLGMVKQIESESEVAMTALKQDMTLAGEWNSTKTKRHKRIRAILGKEYE